MAVSYIDPIERAWERVRGVLLQPFSIETWVVVGFAAFLAGLPSQWAGLKWTQRVRVDFPPDFGELFRWPWSSWGHSPWLLWGLPLAGLGLLVGVALLWLSSRGKFIFLENMLTGRGAIVEPWKRYGRLGDSLFLWRLGFCLAALLVFAVLLAPMAWAGRGFDSGMARPFGALAAAGATLTSIALGVLVGLTLLFLESFVVPLMYQRQIRATEAWRVFLVLLRRNPAEFIVYGLLIALAGVAAMLGLLAASVVTCCILPLVLSVPYVQSVLLLPLSGLFRLYSLEFLGQFGPEYVVSGPPAPPAAPSP